MAKIRESRWIGIVIAMLGILMMGYGICRGEVDVVLAKAVRICLECIGIG
ncbi:CD1871A family CXXC motif-containing protein [Bariatricus sp. SGI.154]